MNRVDREAFLSRGKESAEAQAPPFTEAEFERYQERARYIAQAHPELIGGGVANAMAEAGFDFHPVVIVQTVKNAKPEVAAWLLSERGRDDAHALLNVKDSEKRTLEVLERIESRLERQGEFQRPVVRTDDVARTDDYITKRKQDIRNGVRRVR